MDTQVRNHNLFSIFKIHRVWTAGAVLLFACGMLGIPSASAKSLQHVHPASVTSQKAQKSLSKKVYDRLVSNPWFSVFDNLGYKIQGSTLTLTGQVVFPLSSHSVEQSVKGLPGVKHIVNHVQNLPYTPFDNQIRRAEYRALFYGQSPLFHYSLGWNPRIHIIVKNSRVTLVGVVDSKMDREIASMRARSVPNVFSVKNDLSVS